MKVNLVNENFYSDYLTNLLHARGVVNVEDFLQPTDKYLSDPGLLDNINQGALWLEETLNKENSKILVIVDCDVDGFTSGAIMWNYIHAIAPMQELAFMLHEHKQHGLEDCCQEILDSNINYDLIILPDSSSNDYKYHELLGERGTRCLVLDHHEVDEKIFSEHACIINNQLSERYLNKDLTGAGIAWQFCRYHESLGTTDQHVADSLIDLAALGICGDMGSVLSMENRYIMSEGFANINNYFFESAVEKQSYSMGGVVNATTVAFYIVPMMNAMIRVGSMEEKQRLFMALVDGHYQVPCNKRGAKGTTEEVAIESLRECTNAKAKQGRITDQMVEKLEQKIFKYDLLENKILFVRLDDDDDFPSEINGLIAMKLAAKFKRPTIVTRLGPDGFDKGSIRNISDCELSDLKAFLNESGYFEYVQGHANAAGCCINDAQLRAFHEYANDALANINFNEGVYDVNFARTMYDKDLAALIFDLGSRPEVWGQGNPVPLIYVSDLYLDKSDIQVIGAKQDTVKIEKNGVAFMKFRALDMIDELNRCNQIKLNVVGKANLNNWGGQITPQLFIENYEIVDDLFEF
jgi:single-stranded-DNA-specific exonuclease